MIPPTMSDSKQSATRWPIRLLLAFATILALAAFFRLYGLNWDQGHYFHPDERFIATVMDGRLSLPSPGEWQRLLDPDQSPLNTRSVDDEGNPRDFAYGSLPFILATLLGGLLSLPFETDLTSYEHVGLFGRVLTALVDLGTVVLVMLFARKAFGDLAALISGGLTGASVVLIQLAHYFTVDAWVTFFTMAVLYACLHLIQGPTAKWSLVAGALGGAALATKVSVGVLGIPIIVALAIGASATVNGPRNVVKRVIERLAIAAGPAVAVFALFEPYAIWRPAAYIGDIREQWEIVNAQVDVPFTRQFVGTVPGVTEVQDLVLWGLAPGFGIAALIATAVGLFWCIRDRDPRYLVLMSWIVPYFLVIASSEARFLRYSAPLVPPLAVIVGHQLSYWWHHRQAGLRSRFAPGLAISLTLGVTIVWAVAYMTVYSGPHPRVEASEWIYRNVEPEATITSEVWDDSLPVRLDSAPQVSYERLAMDLYTDRAPEEAFDYIAGTLDDADYVILSSQRLSHSIPRLPWRYPVQSAYYRLLEEEKLGFELAFEATNYPGFGSYRVNTLNADESFSVYDHPPVRVFRKVDELSRDELRLRFAHALEQPWIAGREPPEPPLRLMEPVGRQPGAEDVGWSSGLTGAGIVATGVWVLTVLVLGVTALPLSLRLFPRFADSGVALTPLLGLIGVGLLTWLSWSFGFSGFHVWTILGSLILLAGTSWWLLGPPEFWSERLRNRKVAILIGVGVFAAVFALFTLIRSANPDLWHPAFGGERPMEMAYTNAIARSESFPPYDPWFADGYLNYYYYGFFLFATLAKLTGIPIAMAFQLMLATVAAMLAGGAYSLGSTLTGSIVQTRRASWLVSGGLLAVFLTVLAGNLDAIRQILDSGSFSVDFWASSRVVEFGITEFPYFSFLYGDLHPHVLAAPMLVLVVSLVCTWVIESGGVTNAWVALWTAAVTIVAGTITVTNAWDGPTAGVLIVTGLLLPTLRRAKTPWRRVVRAVALVPIMLLGAWSLFYPFHSRFLAQTDGLRLTDVGTSIDEWFIHFGGMLIILVLVFVMAIGRMLTTNPFDARFLFYGAILAIFGYLAGAAIGWGLHGSASMFVLSGALVAIGGASIAQAPSALRSLRDRAIALMLISPFIALAGILAWERPVGAVGSLLVAVFLTLYFANQQRNGVLVGAIAGAAGAGLILTADLVYVADHLQDSEWERMNTVFKLYYQAWTLLAISAAATGMWVVLQARKHFFADEPRPKGANSLNLAGAVGAIVGAPVLIFALVAYPVFASHNRIENDMASSPAGLSLDGYAWMEGGNVQNQAGDMISFSGDAAAIDWLREHVDWPAVVLEASIGPYVGGGSRISSATGLPAVLGWESHQSQQRRSQAVGQRSLHVREMYDSDDIERKRYLLRQYQVDYVVVGDVERYTLMSDIEATDEPDYYASEAGLRAFEALVGEELTVVFESDGTTIYRVNDFSGAGRKQ